jgi:hypothetical protein
MEIQAETPIYESGETQYTLLRYAAMAAKWKEPPRDALDTLTLNSVDMKSLDSVEQLDYMPFDPIVKRTEGTVIDISSSMKGSFASVSVGESPQTSTKSLMGGVSAKSMNASQKCALFNGMNAFKTTKGAPHVILKLVNSCDPSNAAALTRQVMLSFVLLSNSINLHRRTLTIGLLRLRVTCIGWACVAFDLWRWLRQPTGT